MLNMNTHVTTKRVPVSLLSPFQLLLAALAGLVEWERRARERKSLGEMPDHMLKDLGITRNDAVREAEKPFWRPDHPSKGEEDHARPCFDRREGHRVGEAFL
jgi:uncharacterized protein YjiS (DUF1127 family)